MIMDPPVLEVQRPLLNPPTDISDCRPQIKTILIFSIVVIVLLLILTLSATIIIGKKNQLIPSNISTITDTVSTTTKSSPSKTTTAVSTNSRMTSSTTSELKPTGCQLPLIPSYNTNKIIVAGSESSGSSVYELNKPIALALDSQSNLFVVDANNFRVLKYIPNSKTGEIVLGHGTDRFPRASNIIGLFIDKNDLLYTCQYDSVSQNEIIIWPSSSKNGTIIMTMSARISTFTIDRDSNIYIIMGINLFIYYAPRYKESISKRVFGKPFINGQLPTSSSSAYLDANSNLYAIDIDNYRIQKSPIDDEYSETIVQKSPTLVAIVVDCHNNLYTIDSNASLIIYNSSGDIISTMYNTIDNPVYSDSWIYSSRNEKKMYIPDYFASLILDSKNGDLYVAMFGYNRVTKFVLNK